MLASSPEQAKSSPAAQPSPGPTLRVFHSTSVTPPMPHDARSPSLRHAEDRTPAYEMKFLLEEGKACAVAEQLSAHLTPDPHGNVADGLGYQLATLYCDTPEWDVFHRRGRHRLFKLRLRKYSQSEMIYLERKSKRKDHVRKRRSTIAEQELARFAEPPARSDWNGGWYHRQLRRNELSPVCLLQYERMAYFGYSSEGPLRLTFDRHIAGGLTREWSFERPLMMHSLLPGMVVCEFKYRGLLPSLFKQAICDQQLSLRGVSKFRHCLRVAGGVEDESKDSQQ